LVLENINEPSDLQNLTTAQLIQLAAEIRDRILTTVSANGGHLASSLGAVELTIALHRSFNSPVDKIVWDVGHQAYAHKLLTGRRESFRNIRQYGGLSGFLDREESPHDHFVSGHASIGALSKQFSKMRFDRRYFRARNDASQVVKRMPLEHQFRMLVARVEKGLKGMIIPSMYWEELGFTYMGPIDGHNIAEMEEAFAHAREYRLRPLLVHVVTTKGKGYSPAEDDAVSFHGISPQCTEKAKAISYSDAFGDAVLRIARENHKVVAITAAMAEGTGLTCMMKEFPKRVFDVGICEQHAVTFAAGLATQGFIPIIAIYSTFLQRALDQIIHDVCIQNLPVVFAIDRGGIVGEDGKTHQGSFDLSYLSFIPNMVVAAPKDENELQHLLYTAVQARRPFAIRYPRGSGLGVTLDKEFRKIPVGKWEILRDGNDLVIFATGFSVSCAIAAAKKLAKIGIECTVVNSRFIKPLDSELILDLTRRHTRFITVEENAVCGGFGSAVVSLLKSAKSDVRVECIGIPDEFVAHGPQKVLRAKYNLDAEGIEQRIVSAFPELSVSLPTKPNR